MPETTNEIPKALETMVDMVLRYRPKPTSAAQKKRKRKQKKAITIDRSRAPRVAEFFAGIGLVRRALEGEGFRIVFANDIEPTKAVLYQANFDASDLVVGDVCSVRGRDVPDIDVATASFPCTDLSLAGNRAGLAGKQSGMFWEFARVLDEMGKRRPSVVMLENVPGFATSRGGQDMRDALAKLAGLGYQCDVIPVDARWFVPQSRPRMFIVGSRRHDLVASPLLRREPPVCAETLSAYVDRLSSEDPRWWPADRLGRFLRSLSPIQAERVAKLRCVGKLEWSTAYRRTRNGCAVWEVRPDSVSGCLRTARGGSSKQAVMETGHGDVRVRWMSAREYARLQGAPDFHIDDVSENAAIFGFGDAVCVPAVAWVARSYLLPLLQEKFPTTHRHVTTRSCPVGMSLMT
jgi:DNA (cytosine-5)-methyltransferase 1